MEGARAWVRNEVASEFSVACIEVWLSARETGFHENLSLLREVQARRRNTCWTCSQPSIRAHQLQGLRAHGGWGCLAPSRP